MLTPSLLQEGEMKGHWALTIVAGGVVVAAFSIAAGLGSQAASPWATPWGVAPPGRVEAPPSVVINEVAWGGTAADPTDEWIELYNSIGVAVDLAGWTLEAVGGAPAIALSGSIPARGYYLLERTDDCTVSDIPADLTYAGGLENAGEHLRLLDAGSTLIDSLDASSGWPGGTASPGFYTMERIDVTAGGEAPNWGSNNGLVRNGLDCEGQALNGTPKARNSVSHADLSVDKQGADSIGPSEAITYTIIISNPGQLPAQSVWLTDILPSKVTFLSQDAVFPFSQPDPGTLVWDLGTVPTATAATPIRLTVSGLVDGAALGKLTNAVTITSATTESRPADNHDALVTIVGEPVMPVVLIESLYAQTYGGIDDEAFRLMNVSTATANIAGWTLTDGEGIVTFPAGANLAPGQRVWCSRKADAFYEAFGFLPGYEWGGGHPAVPDLGYSGSLRFNDDGDDVTLRNGDGELVDVLVYGQGLPPGSGWHGPAIQPYNPTSTFPPQGQILYRKRDQRTGWPVTDTDGIVDWAQDPGDAVNGRKVQYPGWDLDQFFEPAQVTETAVLTVAVGPDHLLETVLAQIEGAQKSIWIEGYTIESAAVARALIQGLEAGVAVTMLLEGGPTGGIADGQRWICDQVQDAGGRVYFLSSTLARPRYRAQHGKFLVIDDRLVMIGSENLNPTSMPADDKGDGTAGRRGVYLITNAPGVVDRVRAILAADVDPAHHRDVVPCAQVPDLCTGAPPPQEPNWTSYTVAFPAPLTVRGELAFEMLQSPDNSLRDRDGLLGLVAQAGPGDRVLVEQFYEAAHWGPDGATPETDPNPRLEAYLEAARRGASVRVLLDAHYDQGDNAATVAYLQNTAIKEGLDLQARLGDPTYLGLHNKMVLAQIGGQGYVHAGSINGREVSSKANRELALQVRSSEAYEYLKAVFDHDWGRTDLIAYLPLVVKDVQIPLPAAHLLIGEVYFPADPERQWVEIHNPTDQAVDLGVYKIGDAASVGDYEGMFQFPTGTFLGSHEVLVVAVNAARFREDFPARLADLEIVDSDPAVPSMSRYTSWSEGDWWLRQDGDQVVLLDGSDTVVDAVVYGDGVFPGVMPHPGASHGHSLERYPAWLDTDDCSSDFREQPYPSPGETP